MRKIVLLFVVFAAVLQAKAQLVLDTLNSQNGACNAPCNALSKSFSSLANGAVVIVQASWTGQSLTASVSDGVNTYYPLTQPRNFGTLFRAQWWYAVNAGNPSAVSVTLSGNSVSGGFDGMLLVTSVINGADHTNPIDKSSIATNSGTVSSSFALTTGSVSHSNEMLWTYFVEDSPGTPYQLPSGWADAGSGEALSISAYSTTAGLGTHAVSAKALGGASNWTALSVGIVPAAATAQTGCDGAGNCYVRSAATGSETGADWTNAYKDLPATLTRGVTYWVGGGTYPPHVFNDPVSGTALITIKAPTIASHGTSTGWNGSYQAQALWQMSANGGPIWDVAQESYIVFDGSYCTPLANYPNICTSGYGFKLDTAGHSINANAGNDCGLCGMVQGGYGALGPPYMSHDQTFKYLDLYGSNRSTSMTASSPADAGFSFSGGSYNLYFGHNYVHNNAWQFFLRGDHQGNQVWAPGCGCNITIEYNYLYWSGAGTTPDSPHGTPLDESEGIQNYTVRYNIIADMGGNGATGGTSTGPDTASGADWNSGNGNGGPWYIYGNLWYSDTAQKCAVGDGILAIYDFSMTNGDVWFVNNTVAQEGYPYCGTNTDEVTYGIGIGYATPFRGWYEQDNLWYQADLSQFNGSDIINNGLTSGGTQGGGATFNPPTVHGYNAYFQSPNTASNDNDNNKQVSSADPFLGSANSNFNLSAHTSAGVPLTNTGTYWDGTSTVANTFNVDMNGVTRGTNGGWDRGALQFQNSAALIGTSTRVQSSATQVTQGSSVTLTATVTPVSGTGIPSGSVIFKSGTTTLGSGTLNASGVATLTTTSLAVGTDSITATFSGDSAYATSVSSSVTVTVSSPSLLSTTTAVTASSSQITRGASVTFTATVKGTSGSGVPTGSISFSAGSTALGTATLNAAGVATLATTSLAVGTDSITAAYSGDSAYSASVSPAVTVTVSSPGPVSTTTTLTASSSRITQGASVTFTASVKGTSGSGVPTGRISFSVGSTALGTATLNAAGVATLATTSLAVGTDIITAAYNGDSGCAASVSPSVTVTVTSPGLVSTTTTLNASSRWIRQGASVTFTTTVKGTSGSRVPTGNISFTVGSTALGTAKLNASGVATLTTTALPVGRDSIVASYGGDSAFAASASTAATVTVRASTLINTATTLTPSVTQSVRGSSIQLTAGVTPASGTQMPTGEVTFRNGSTWLGRSALSASGVAQLTTTTLPVGSNTLFAEYRGDTTFHSSTSPGVVVTVVLPVAALPTFAPAGGTYAGAQTVAILASTPGSQIFYTTDGTTPSASSTIYSGPVQVASSTRIQAIAEANDYLPSLVASAYYTINVPIPFPDINYVSPAVARAGSATLNLVFYGSGFAATSAVLAQQTPLAVHYSGPGQLEVEMPSALIARGGIIPITVNNPTTAGGNSNVFQFEIDTAPASLPPPLFNPSSATVAAGTVANFPVTLPSNVSNPTAACLNGPPGLTCSYSAQTGLLSMGTSSTMRPDTYHVTVVFTESISSAAKVTGHGQASLFLSALFIPLLRRNRKKSRRLAYSAVLMLALCGLVFITGCAGFSLTSTSHPATEQVTSSAVVALTIQ